MNKLELSTSVHIEPAYSTPIGNSLTLTSLLTLRFPLALCSNFHRRSISSRTSHSLQHSFNSSDCCCRSVDGICWYNNIQPPRTVAEQNNEPQIDPGPVDNIPKVLRQSFCFEILTRGS